MVMRCFLRTLSSSISKKKILRPSEIARSGRVQKASIKELQLTLKELYAARMRFVLAADNLDARSRETHKGIYWGGRLTKIYENRVHGLEMALNRKLRVKEKEDAKKASAKVREKARKKARVKKTRAKKA
jgi:hypothetical protein